MNQPPAPLTGWTDATPRVLAIDPAMNSSGVVWSGGIQTYRGGLLGMARISWMRGWVQSAVRIARPDVVVLEGYSMGSKGSSALNIAEFGGVLRFTLHELGIPVVEIPPSSLKLFATGSGASEKDAMIAEAVRRLGYLGSSRDEADALWLYALGMWAYGFPIVQLPASHLRGKITEVQWPALAMLSPAVPMRAAAPRTETDVQPVKPKVS